jgi:hypothetical protein
MTTQRLVLNARADGRRDISVAAMRRWLRGEEPGSDPRMRDWFTEVEPDVWELTDAGRAHFHVYGLVGLEREESA